MVHIKLCNKEEEYENERKYNYEKRRIRDTSKTRKNKILNKCKIKKIKGRDLK